VLSNFAIRRAWHPARPWKTNIGAGIDVRIDPLLFAAGVRLRF
jgi:hypothetical protein